MISRWTTDKTNSALLRRSRSDLGNYHTTHTQNGFCWRFRACWQGGNVLFTVQRVLEPMVFNLFPPVTTAWQDIHVGRIDGVCSYIYTPISPFLGPKPPTVSVPTRRLPALPAAGSPSPYDPSCSPLQSGNPYEAVCDGCPTPCVGCHFEDPTLEPMCLEVMPHATSTGGPTTVETVSIDPGFWRATDSSTEVLACYNPDACLGGMTGTSGFCLESYSGPCGWLCSVLDLSFFGSPLYT